MTRLSRHEDYQFDVLDNRRRMVGARIVTWERDGKFWVGICNTRDGWPWGAFGRDRVFDTLPARDAAILKYLNAAQKRFTRRFGRV
jgi:hypothetical protein